MSPEMRREIRFAGNAVLIEYDHPLAEEILDSIIYLFEDTGAGETYSRFQLIIDESASNPFVLIHNGQKAFTSTNQVNMTENLLSLVCHELADKSSNGMLFHAAGLSNGKEGLLIPGGIGAGKTTLTAWMLSLGFNYLSDELVYIPWQSKKMISFHRPLNIKKNSCRVLDKWINFGCGENGIQSGIGQILVNPTLVNQNTTYSQPNIKWVLFPQHQEHSDLNWKNLTQAQTGFELMKSLINARNLPNHGFKEVTRLARNIIGFKFTYSSFDQIEGLIHQFI